jgi:hypothetical protein
MKYLIQFVLLVSMSASMGHLQADSNDNVSYAERRDGDRDRCNDREGERGRDDVSYAERRGGGEGYDRGRYNNAPEGNRGAYGAGYERGMNEGAANDNNNSGNQNPVYIMPEGDAQGQPGYPVGPQ